MTLTKYEDVQKWFNANQVDHEDGTGKNPVHWTLYGGNYGEKEARLLSNTRIANPAESLEYLITSIRMMNNPSGAKFRVQLFRPGSPNNYSAQAYVQVYDNAAAAPGAQPAAIGNLPAMSPVTDERYIQERIDLAILRRENEELRAALNGPGTWERVLDIVSQSEPLSMALAGLIGNLAGKGAIPAPIARPVTGNPSTDDTDDTEGKENDPQTVFSESIQSAANGLETDPVTMARKLKKIVQDNPQFAKQIFSQI